MKKRSYEMRRTVSSVDTEVMVMVLEMVTDDYSMKYSEMI